MPYLEDILWPDGQDNMGSLQRLQYYCKLSDIDSFPEVPAAGAAGSLAGNVTLEGNITFVSGKGWQKLYTTQDTGMVEDEMVGERDGKSWKNKMKIFHPGNKPQALGFAREIANSDMVFLAIDAEGQMRIIGSDGYPAEPETNTITTAETTEGRKGMTLEVSCASRTPAPVYEGDLTLAPESGSSSS